MQGPQIKRILKDYNFDHLLSSVEKDAKQQFQISWATIKMGVNMSLKNALFTFPPNFFSENLGNINDEHDARFHLDLKSLLKLSKFLG